MDYHPRLIEPKLTELVRHFPVVTVTGARQTGKSTLIQHLFGTSHRTVVFDPHLDAAGARQDPDFFLQNHPPPLFLDEVQYAPELLGAIKRKVDQDGQNGQYILSGSQHLAVTKGVAESLAGRSAVVQLHPLCWRELQKETARPAFLRSWLAGERPQLGALLQPTIPVTRLIWRGMHPRLIELPDPMTSVYWESYLQTYVERDIRSVADVGSLQTFGRFITLLAAHTAAEVNQNQLGRELGVDRTTAVRWTEVAEATFQWISVPAYSRNAGKRIAGRRKGFFTDAGFVCHLQRIPSPEALPGHPLFGALFESWVVMEILKSFQEWPVAPALWHYRTYAGAEVDVILEHNGRLFPIEIKATSAPAPRDIAGIQSFRECFPREAIAPGLLVCAVAEPRQLPGGVLAIPWWAL